MTAPLDPDAMPQWLREVTLATNGPSLGHELLTHIDDDDCAVLVLRPGEPPTVLSTDFINASPIGLQLGISSQQDLGWLVVAVNALDVLSSGAIPRAFLLAATLSRGTSTVEFEQLISGVLEACEQFNLLYIGGDTKLGQSRAIAGTCIGRAASASHLLLRNRAEIGDDVWLTGACGDCGSAVLLLSATDSPASDEDVRAAISRPVLDYEVILNLVTSGKARAATDVSDGLIADAHAIARASHLGVHIETRRLPIGPVTQRAVAAGLVATVGVQCAIGGDLRILFTASASHRAYFNTSGFHRVGYTSRAEGVHLVTDNTSMAVGFEGHRDARGITFAEEVRLLANYYTR